MRHHLIRMYHQSPEDIREFIAFNHKLSTLFTAPLTLRLRRLVLRYGAPVRVLKSMAEEPSLNLPNLLSHRDLFLEAYQRQISHEYQTLGQRLKRGIIKSIIFLFLTKALVGIGLEIPYDILTTDTVAILPLVINLLFPPFYMASLKFGLHTPSSANTKALIQYIDTTFYGDPASLKLPYAASRTRTSFFAKMLYTLLFMIPFGITIYILMLLRFTVVQGVIFFVFISTASFLGFRLSRLVRELEYVTSERNFMTTVHDFFYLPFMLAGQWLSGKYAKINVMGLALDMVIELPLKTILRLIRQSMRFLHEKQEEML